MNKLIFRNYSIIFISFCRLKYFCKNHPHKKMGNRLTPSCFRLQVDEIDNSNSNNNSPESRGSHYQEQQSPPSSSPVSSPISPTFVEVRSVIVIHQPPQPPQPPPQWWQQADENFGMRTFSEMQLGKNLHIDTDF